MHKEPHEHARQTVKVKSTTKNYGGSNFRIEDWWDRVAGKSWMMCNGNPVCMEYGIRTGLEGEVPTDNEVVYGKIGGFGVLFHVSELELPEKVEHSE